MTLGAGESAAVSWTIFWHRGWDDFFAQAATLPNFVRLEADRYAVTLGESVTVRVVGPVDLQHSQVSVNGMPLGENFRA